MKAQPSRRRQPIVASIPGRMRLRAAGLACARAADEACARLGVLPALLSVRTNPAASSVVIEYDPGLCDEPAMQRAVLAALQPWVGSAAPRDEARAAPAGASTGSAAAADASSAAASDAADSARRQRHSRKRLVARCAKYGMMASLGGSLVAAAAGAKSTHVALGGVFLGFVGAHVFGYRRTLLR